MHNFFAGTAINRPREEGIFRFFTIFATQKRPEAACGAHSSVGQSSGLIIRRSWDHAPLGPQKTEPPESGSVFLCGAGHRRFKSEREGGSRKDRDRSDAGCPRPAHLSRKRSRLEMNGRQPRQTFPAGDYTSAGNSPSPQTTTSGKRHLPLKKKPASEVPGRQSCPSDNHARQAIRADEAAIRTVPPAR